MDSKAGLNHVSTADLKVLKINKICL